MLICMVRIDIYYTKDQFAPTPNAIINRAGNLRFSRDSFLESIVPGSTLPPHSRQYQAKQNPAEKHKRTGNEPVAL